MADGAEAAALLRSARLRAGLSQRALARRALTTQAVIARIEAGGTSPGWGTLVRLLRAAGFDLHSSLVERPTARSHMMRDVERIRRLSPTDRLREIAAVNRFVASTRRA